jgi:hypothetical protein
MPPNEQLESGKRNVVTVKKLAYKVEIRSPKHGDVFLAGDRIPLDIVVKGVDLADDAAKPEVLDPKKDPPKVEVSSGCTLADDLTSVRLPAGDGESTIRARYGGAQAEVSVRTLLPAIVKLELLDPDGQSLVDLYDHAAKDFVRNVFEWKPG